MWGDVALGGSGEAADTIGLRFPSCVSPLPPDAAPGFSSQPLKQGGLGCHGNGIKEAVCAAAHSVLGGP